MNAPGIFRQNPFGHLVDKNYQIKSPLNKNFPWYQLEEVLNGLPENISTLTNYELPAVKSILSI